MKKNWNVDKLGDVCILVKRGISPKYTDEQNKLIVINQKCIRNHKIDLNLSRRHDEEVKVINLERLVQFGDVLVNSTGTGTLGRVAQVRDQKFPKATVDTHVTIVRPKKELFDIEYFGYAMIFIENLIKEAGEGASGQTELRRTIICNKFNVFYPNSTKEQKAIVKILDEAFAKIDQAKANIEKNIVNAKELFQSKLNEIFSQRGEGWEAITLNDACEFYNGKAHEKDIDEKGKFVVVNSKFISRDGKVRKFTSKQMFPLFKSDIVMVMSDVPNGKALAKCLIIDENERYSLNQRICAIRSDHFHTKFLYYSLNRNPYFLSYNNGENQTNLRKGDILRCPLFLPSIEVQINVANGIDSFRKLCFESFDLYERELNNLVDLKKSLLQKAFSGELV